MMWTIFVILYWLYFSWLNHVSWIFVANDELRLRWIHCGRCNVCWFQALLVRLASELTEILDKRWRPPRQTDPRRTPLVLQAMSYKEPQSLGSMCWNRLKENIAKEVHQIKKKKKSQNDRIKQFPGESLCLRNGKRSCDACKELLSSKKSIL